MIKLAGGRGSAEAAAAVTQLPLTLDDCQRGLGGALAVRRAQRNRRDLAEERRRQTRGEKDEREGSEEIRREQRRRDEYMGEGRGEMIDR